MDWPLACLCCGTFSSKSGMLRPNVPPTCAIYIYIPLRSDDSANKRRFLVKVSREGRLLCVYLKEKERISTFPVCRHCSGSSVQAEFGRLVLKTPFVEKLRSLLRKDGRCSDSQLARKGSTRLKSPRTQIYGYIGSLAVWLVHKEMFINF